MVKTYNVLWTATACFFFGEGRKVHPYFLSFSVFVILYPSALFTLLLRPHNYRYTYFLFVPFYSLFFVINKCIIDITVFDVPRTLKVGTLDTLMTLSDEVGRTDSYIEGVVKKVERQVAESYFASSTAELLKAGKEITPGSIKPLQMYVPGPDRGPVPVHDWANTFKWDSNAWGENQESLSEILRRLSTAAEKVDADIRVYTQAYQERKTAFVTAERKKSGNLMVAALEDIITPEVLTRSGSEYISSDSEYLATMVVILQKAQEESFLETYTTIDGESVPLGPEGRRENVRGSPVVPGSARRLAEDKDGYVLYTVVILKKFIDSFRAACREKRFAVRDFNYDPLQAGSIAREVEERNKELTAALAQLKTESRRKYGEVMQIWFHVKAIRVFIESVLRYGLPVRFASILFKINRTTGSNNTENVNKLLNVIKEEWKGLTGGRSGFDDAYSSKNNNGNDPVIPGISDATTVAAAHPFVFFDLDIKQDTSQLSK